MIKSTLLKNLNQEQLEAVTHGNGPLLVIAGAGTGKTTVIAHRIAWLIEQKLAKPEEILAVTFTDKATNEMDGRILELLPYGVLNFTASTFHSFCQDILKDYGITAGISPDFRLLTESQQILFLKQNLDEFKLNLYKPISNPNKFLASLVKLFSRAKDELTTPKDYQKLAESYRFKAQTNPHDLDLAEKAALISEESLAYQTYEQLKRKENYFDFGDLIIKSYELLNKRPSVLSELQKKYKYIFVDEFQDTNYAQVRLIYKLAQKYQNITVVGDDDQSIYKFRGASISNIMEFLDHFSKARKVVLTKNYRSTQEILDSSHQLIKHNNPYRLEVREKINKKLTGEKIGKPPEFWHFPHNLSEVEEIIKFIINDIDKNKKKFGDYAILIRANSYADDFITLLKNNGISYQFIGSRGLYDREEIRELISYLKVLSNPDDNLALFHLSWAEQFGIDKITLRRLTNLAKSKTISLFEIFETIDKILPKDNQDISKIKKIIGLIKNHLECAGSWTTSKILMDYIYKSGAYNFIKNIDSYEAMEKVENIRLFFGKISEFESVSREKDVFSFMEYLDLIIEAGDNPAIFQADKYENAINIMTIHAAKGLEFDTVFMPYLTHDRFPSRGRRDLIELPDELVKETLPSGDIHTEEERRLFYVAMTRAKNRLILSASREYQGAKLPKRVSSFVEEAVNKKDRLDFTKQKNIDFSKLDNEKPKKIPEKKSEIILSPSAMETFSECPKRFEYAYIFKVKILPSQSLSFGNSIHNTLRDIYKIIQNKKLITEKLIADNYQNNWQEEGYVSKSEKERAYQLGLEAIKKIIKNDKIMPSEIEKKFHEQLGECKISGRIDRIDDQGEYLEIIDYKTSDGRKKTISELNQNIPLSIYAMYISKLNPHQKIKLSLHYILSNRKITVDLTAQRLALKREKIYDICKRINQAIKTHNFIASPSDYKCKICAYKSICPYKTKGS